MDQITIRHTLKEILKEAQILPGQDGNVYAQISLGQDEPETATVVVPSADLRRWVSRKFCSVTGQHPPALILTEVIANCAADLCGADIGLPVGSRICQSDSGATYIDLGDQTDRAIRVSSEGWTIDAGSVVIFPSNPNRLALPEPKAGGTIDAIAETFSLSPSDVVLIVSWLLACLRGTGPYPVLVITGPDGSGKSTLAKFLRDLIDPSNLFLRTLPSAEKDLAILARANFVLGFDNIISIPDRLADALYRIAKGTTCTGFRGGLEEVLFQGQRPIILVGAGEFVTRPDLIRHSIVIRLKKRPAQQCKNQRDMARALMDIYALIFGALLDTVVKGLGRLELPSAGPAKELGMPEFEKFIDACEPGLWDEGTFWAAYEVNRAAAAEDVVNLNPALAAVRQVVGLKSFCGTAGELLALLNAQYKGAKGNLWPSTPRGLSGLLRREACALPDIEMELDIKKGRNRDRIMVIKFVANAVDVCPELAPVENVQAGKTVRKRLRTNVRPAAPAQMPLFGTIGRLADGADGADGVAGQPQVR